MTLYIIVYFCIMSRARGPFASMTCIHIHSHYFGIIRGLAYSVHGVKPQLSGIAISRLPGHVAIYVAMHARDELTLAFLHALNAAGPFCIPDYQTLRIVTAI